MIRDACGRLVQHRLEPAFDARLTLLDWCAHLRGLWSILRRLEESKCVTIPQTREVERLLSRARELVLSHAPWEVCHCQGANRHCPTCQGRGWLELAQSRQPQQSADTASSAPVAA